MTGKKKYATYSFEDFLQDDFFIESIKRPTREKLDFWENFLEAYPQQSEPYHAARRFLEDVIHPQHVSDIWNSLQAKIERTRKLRKTRKIVFSLTAAAAAAAASIAVLLAIRLLFIPPSSNAMMDFVSSNLHPTVNSEEIQLVVSEQKTIYFHEKEAVITYDSANIRVDSENLPKNEVASYNQLIVPYGKSSILTLHDGTKIWVNAGTRVVYPVEFKKNKREIYVDGEIFIDVTPDTQRPFTVRTNDLRIQVMGTKFNVHAYSSDELSKIALESGLVKISSETAEDVLLSPNKVYEQDKDGHSSVNDADISTYTSWIHGLYMYKNERLEEILKRLERYYGIAISVDPSAAELRCAGKLDMKENVEDVLLNISLTAPIGYIKDSERYIVSYQPKNNSNMSP